MKVFQYSNTGNRETNQDYVLSKDFGQGISLYLVADGIGGYEHGEMASKIVAEEFANGLAKGLSLEDTTKAASQSLMQEKYNLGVLKMGTTVAGVLLKDTEASIFWSGDSRVYVFRSGQQIYQTKDHSLLNQLAEKRPLNYEERKRYQHIITRSIMGSPDDSVDIHNMTLLDGDELLVCTDGIYNDCPVDYLMESIRTNTFDIDKQNEDFSDNHTMIYILI